MVMLNSEWVFDSAINISLSFGLLLKIHFQRDMIRRVGLSNFNRRCHVNLGKQKQAQRVFNLK